VAYIGAMARAARWLAARLDGSATDRHAGPARRVTHAEHSDATRHGPCRTHPRCGPFRFAGVRTLTPRPRMRHVGLARRSWESRAPQQNLGRVAGRGFFLPARPPPYSAVARTAAHHTSSATEPHGQAAPGQDGPPKRGRRPDWLIRRIRPPLRARLDGAPAYQLNGTLTVPSGRPKAPVL
jgi:hypothetical protein